MNTTLAYLSPLAATFVMAFGLLGAYFINKSSKVSVRYFDELDALDKRAHEAVTAFDIKQVADALISLDHRGRGPECMIIMSYLAGRIRGCVLRATPSAPKPKAGYVYTHPIPAEPPEGYRFLWETEQVLTTDRAFDPDTGEWTPDCASAANYEESYARDYHAVIRKMPEKVRGPDYVTP